jgi:hypothetical protein
MPATKKRKSENVLKKRKFSSPLANFLAMFGGFTVLITALLLLYSALFTEAQPSSTDGDPQITDSITEESSSKIGLSTSATMTEFMKSLSSATAQELFDFLIKMNIAKSAQESIPVRIEWNRKRVKAAEQLMLLNSTSEQYELAAMSKLLALSAIYNLALESNFSLNVDEESDQLLKYAKSLINDSSTSLKLHGGLTVLGLELLETSKSPDALSKVDEKVTLLLNLLRETPESPEAVTKYFEMIFPRILKEHEAFGIELAKGLVKHQAEFDSDQAKHFFEDMYDTSVLVPKKLRRKLDSIWSGDEEQIQELIQLGLELAADTQSGEMVLNELALLTHWLEQKQDYEDAKLIYQVLLDTASERSTPRLATRVTRDGNHGLQRCQAVGNKLEFVARLIDGSQLEASQFNNHFVVILFASYERMNYLKLLNELNSEFASLSNQNVKFIVAFLEQNPDKSLAKVLERYSLIHFVIGDESFDPSPTILQQYPAHIIPQAIIVNPRGVVVRTALKPLEMSENVKKEILKWNTR